MSLKPLQTGGQPLGQFDCLDADLAGLLGGEVMTFTQVVNTVATDKGAKDAFDGYQNPNLRTVAAKATASTSRPLMLADEGITGYGTLFGSVVGGTVGQQVTGGALLGPHTALASGKATLWAAAGLYAVSLDSVHSSLVVTSTAVDAGDALSYTSGGIMCLKDGSSEVSGAPAIGTFVEFQNSKSLVNTPNHLVGTFNAPDGNLSTTTTRSFDYLVLWFNPSS